MTFEEALASGRVLLADGAMGTMLYARGAPLGGSFDALNLTHPDWVREVHLEYLLAGAEIILTNTFGANPVRLAAHGLSDRVRAVNLEGVKIARAAREAAGVPAFIAGDIGPTGRALEPVGSLTPAEVRDAYRRQVEALLAGGVDLFVIETISDPRELVLAIQAVRELSRLPIIAEMSFSSEGQTMLGRTPQQMAEALRALSSELRPEVTGVNCGSGPTPALEALEALRREASPPYTRFAAMPNAGLPTVVDGRFVYMAIPAYFGEFARRSARSGGVQVVGGCCGTTPDHIRAMRQALDAEGHRLPATWAQALPAPAASPTTRPAVVAATSSPPRTAPARPVAGGTVRGPGPPLAAPAAAAAPPVGVAVPAGVEGWSGLAGRLQAGAFVISVELDPPRGPVPHKVVTGAAAVREAGADAVNVGDSPMAQVRMSSLATAILIQQQAGIEAILHFTTRDRNLMGIQADLLGAHAMGIRNILALTGDPPGLGNYAHASAVYDVDSIGLVQILSQLNAGVDVSGRAIGQATRFLIGVALNPAAADPDTELERFKRKIAAGAHFAMTQPLFEFRTLEAFFDRMGGPPPIPLLLGVLPLRSAQHAEYLHNEVPGIEIPEQIRAAMGMAGERAEALGMEVALSVVQEAHRHVAGIYIIPSYGKYEQSCELTRQVRRMLAPAPPVPPAPFA